MLRRKANREKLFIRAPSHPLEIIHKKLLLGTFLGLNYGLNNPARFHIPYFKL